MSTGTPRPGRQYIVTLAGESEIELESGKKIRLCPGHLLLAERQTRQGHISRAVPGQDRVTLTIPLDDGAIATR